MIIGKLVTLGPVTLHDADILFRWANDSETALMNEPYKPVHWSAHQEWWSSFAKERGQVLFAIRSHNSPGLIGYVQIGQIDPIHRAAVLGLRIGEKVNRGQGFGREVLQLAVDYCWNHLNLSRIGLSVFRNNQAAIRLYEQAGFKREGLLRKAVFIDGQWIDLLLMGKCHASRRTLKRRTLER
ncbi:MAG TPA: GNAT family N-acetyltransferase [Rhodospirillaceae bacterium]|nr:GNAT family N-acetyltransferase [Rhodospirillaceae bacterium]